MRNQSVPKLLVIVLGLSGVCILHAETNLDNTRNTLQQWVETRKIISDERSQWKVDQDTLQESIDLMKQELKTLDERIKQSEESTTQADKERQALTARNDKLKQASATVENAIGKLEAKVIAIAKYFPGDLSKKIEPLFKRIPKSGETAGLSLSERLQNIVGILSEVEKFNRTITVVSELQKLPSGDTAQVKTLYLGLAQGYFVDSSHNYAGILVPGPNGWETIARPELAGKIANAIAIYENEKLAEFVDLPITIK